MKSDFLVIRGAKESWQHEHNRIVAAARFPGNRNKPGYAIVQGLDAWNNYAIMHLQRFESTIGEDYVLGPMWVFWGAGLSGLLNGETSGLDCGKIDSEILDTCAINCVSPDMGRNHGIEY